MSASSSSGKSKYREIADLLLDEIRTSGYRDGDTIPTIRVLADRFSVNPQTVNKATAYLVSQGYLQSRQGSGIVVRNAVARPPATRIVMLADAERAKLLRASETATNYHAKDIYLSFLAQSQAGHFQSSFVVYDEGEITAEMREELLRADGFVVQGTLPDHYVEALTAAGKPIVLMNRDLPPAGGDNFGAILVSTSHVRDMCNYLLTMGHRKILYALYADFEQGEVYHNRRAIIDRALLDWRSAQRGSADARVQEFVFDPGSSSADQALLGYVRDGYTAAFGYNDFSALELYRVVRRAGLDVPSDLSVVGFDGLMMGEYATPPLTTVRVNRGRLVEAALSLLARMIDGPVPRADRVQTIETEIVLRSSVAPPQQKPN
jgi:DNA-binding LacI/PurR family transcriptional regulator